MIRENMANVIDNNEKIVVNKDYSDNFSMKQTAMDTLGNKYFADVDLSALNVGELGFVLEQIANITEDSFNTASLLINEAFPNKATIPESIYSHAAIFQLNNAFVSCASCSFIFLLQQSDVLKYGEKSEDEGNVSIYIDKNTIITVADENDNVSIPFTLDYDIQIVARCKDNGSGYTYDYSAQYIMDMKNSISDVKNPYLKIRAIGSDYLILQFTAHQVERREELVPIVSNSKINCPVVTLDFDGDLAGFDILYRSPTSKNYPEFTQLEKRIKFSLPIQSDFCYYKLKDTQTIEISFNTNDKYFQPDFNSEMKVIIYTTMGKKGEFTSYNGNAIDFQMNTEKYAYNNLLTISSKVVSECVGGSERMSIDNLKAMVVESYSSANEISNENDIMNYFYNYKYRYSNEILVVKKRDDIAERLFSAFILLKNGSYIYPTNTLNLNITEDEFDNYDNNTDRKKFTLKPGHVFVYKEDECGVEILKDDDGKAVMVYDRETVDKLLNTPDNGAYTFVYTNPFLISVNKTPTAVGIYKNIVSHDFQLDYVSLKEDTFVHFITGKINVTRVLSEMAEYELSLSLIPSITLNDSEYVDTEKLEDPEYVPSADGNYVRVIVGFVGSGIDENGYVELYPKNVNKDDRSNITFCTKIGTNDYIRSNGEFALTSDNIIMAYNYINTDNNVYIPISDATLNVYILYKTNNGKGNIFTKYPEFTNSGIEDFSVVNIYSTKSEKITFIEPMNMMRSTVTFSRDDSDDNDSTGKYHMTLSSLPMVRADMVYDEDTFKLFVDTLSQNYKYIEASLPMLRNNTHIDVKFYNTYGKSKNYYIGDNLQTQIDRVNITIKFKVTIISGVDSTDVKVRLIEFIKNFVEQLNSSGTNSLYISNLIREIETNFAEIHHLKFNGINSYDTDYQTISVQTTDLSELSKEDLRVYVPEMLVADVDLEIESGI